MKKVIGIILTPIFHIYFGLLLGIFHPIQVVTRYIFGESARRKVVDVLNRFLVGGIAIMGSRPKYIGLEKIPEDRPLIVVSNHQSLYDIPALCLAFKKQGTKFIAKQSLGKGLPSVSYNLKHTESALIDRSNGGQSVREILRVGRLTEKEKNAVCIFPEGTRSQDGKLREFMPAGVNTLVRAAPSALIVPFVIDGHSKLINNAKFPFVPFVKVIYTVLDPIDPKGMEIDDLMNELESKIKEQLHQN